MCLFKILAYSFYADIKTLVHVLDSISNELKAALNEFGGFISVYELGQWVLETRTGRKFLMSSAGRAYCGGHFYRKLRTEMQASHLLSSGVIEEHTLPVDVRSDLVRAPRRAQTGPIFDGLFVVPGRAPSTDIEETKQTHWDIENVEMYKAIGDNVGAVCHCMVEILTKDRKSSGRRAAGVLKPAVKQKSTTFPCSLASCVYLHLIGYRNARKSAPKRRKLVPKLPGVSESDSPTARRSTSVPPSSTDGVSANDMDHIGSMLVPKVAPWRSLPIAPSSLVQLGVEPEDLLGSDISAIDVSFLKSEWEAE